MKINQIAQICHDANRSYCQSLGDQTQKGWNNAPEWQKESAIAGVVFHLQNPDAKPEDSHNSWLAQKAADGWKFGEVKDPEKKEHPCFVPYDELPVNQQKKDLLFISVVNCFRDLVQPAAEEIQTEGKNLIQKFADAGAKAGKSAKIDVQDNSEEFEPQEGDEIPHENGTTYRFTNGSWLPVEKQ